MSIFTLAFCDSEIYRLCTLVIRTSVQSGFDISCEQPVADLMDWLVDRFVLSAVVDISLWAFDNTHLCVLVYFKNSIDYFKERIVLIRLYPFCVPDLSLPLALMITKAGINRLCAGSKKRKDSLRQFAMCLCTAMISLWKRPYSLLHQLDAQMRRFCSTSWPVLHFILHTGHTTNSLPSVIIVFEYRKPMQIT